jgi:hypothetical protein
MFELLNSPDVKPGIDAKACSSVPVAGLIGWTGCPFASG